MELCWVFAMVLCGGLFIVERPFPLSSPPSLRRFCVSQDPVPQPPEQVHRDADAVVVLQLGQGAVEAEHVGYTPATTMTTDWAMDMTLWQVSHSGRVVVVMRSSRSAAGKPDHPRCSQPDVHSANGHPLPRTRTTLQRPHRASRCPGWGWPSPVTLKPHPGHSKLQRNLRRSLLTIRCWLPTFFPDGFAGGVVGAGGAVTLSSWTVPAAGFGWSCSPQSQSPLISVSLVWFA